MSSSWTAWPAKVTRSASGANRKRSPASGPVNRTVEAWGRLGYDVKARESAETAFERAEGLGLTVRLTVEARLRELEGEWEQAAGLYRTLWADEPDEVEVSEVRDGLWELRVAEQDRGKVIGRKGRNIVSIPIPGNPIEPPFVVANLVPDGADLSFIHLISECNNDDVHIGQRVQAVWKPEAEWDYALENIAYFKPIG